VTAVVFDSGLGGLTVLREIRARMPDRPLVYVADTAVFPYGELPADVIRERVTAVIGAAIEAYRPDAVVIACNTASTLVLPVLRARFAVPFVGTVPAIKPAAERSRSRLVSVLATPGTVARDYTRELIATHGRDCRFTLVGARRLAGLAEAALSGTAVADEAIAAEIAPCFVEEGGRRTDTIVLACTHYPLLIERLRGLAPWPVDWIDPAPAIARRLDAVLGGAAPAGIMKGPVFLHTGGAPARSVLERFGFVAARPLGLPAPVLG